MPLANEHHNNANFDILTTMTGSTNSELGDSQSLVSIEDLHASSLRDVSSNNNKNPASVPPSGVFASGAFTLDNVTTASRDGAASKASAAKSHHSHHHEPRWGMRDPLFVYWTRATQAMHNFFGRMVCTFALHSVRNPKAYLTTITIIAITLQAAGFFTNFELILDFDPIITPVGSRPEVHAKWIRSDDGFPDDTRNVQMIFHNYGTNVLHVSQARRVLEAIDLIRTTPGYDDLCAQGVYRNFDNEATCRIISVSGYWKNHNITEFDERVGWDDDVEELRAIISAKEMADGTPVLHDLIVGNYHRDPNTQVLDDAQSYMVQVQLPDIDDTNQVEKLMLERLADLRAEWEAMDKNEEDETKVLRMDILTIYAFQLELLRSIIGDLYLVPICLFLMIGFTCMIFYRRDDKVQSRAMLGLASVVTICMSVFAGNGLMFLIGIPYSAVHQILPFVIFGIGLDDTFIITGAYFRTSPNDPIEKRIETTMKEVGPSITLTTFTTVFAFCLGYFTSSLPGVHWVCLYAMTIIAIDFYFQITYFVAYLVLDERRIKANKKDCCFWKTVEEEKSISFDEDGTGEVTPEGIADQKIKNAAKANEPDTPTKIMIWYSHFLMKPAVKVAVLILFALLFGVMAWSATLMEQNFNVADYVATDSYLTEVFTSLDEYSSVVRPMGVYFRDIDQLDPEIQEQMITFVNELEALPQIDAEANVTIEDILTSDQVANFCWVRDLPQLIEYYLDEMNATQAWRWTIGNMTRKDQLDYAFTQPIFREVYGQDIVRDDDGNVIASRCMLFLTNLDLEDVEDQMGFLLDQREVTEAQPLNQLPEHTDNWAMFNFETLFFYWEAYVVSVNELVTTVISGVISVTIISFLFIPHWSAACIVFPTILVLYINLVGLMRLFGMDINALTYLCIVVAIGLLVDFLMHILLRYYEARPDQTREERVKEVLQTMGVSILVGGFTTLLGVLPLAISSMKIFLTVFYAFFAMVTLGVSHGLILIPVILSYVGPTHCVRGHHLATKPDFHLPSSTSSSSSNTTKDNKHNVSPEQARSSIDTQPTVEIDASSGETEGASSTLMDSRVSGSSTGLMGSQHTNSQLGSARSLLEPPPAQLTNEVEC